MVVVGMSSHIATSACTLDRCVTSIGTVIRYSSAFSDFMHARRARAACTLPALLYLHVMSTLDGLMQCWLCCILNHAAIPCCGPCT